MSLHTSSEVFLCTSEFHVCEKEKMSYLRERGDVWPSHSSEVAICVVATYIPPTGCAGLGWAVLYWIGLGWALNWTGQG